LATTEHINQPHLKAERPEPRVSLSGAKAESRGASSLGDRVRSLRLPTEPEPGLLARKSTWVTFVLLLFGLAGAVWVFNEPAEPLDEDAMTADAAPAAVNPSTPAPTAKVVDNPAPQQTTAPTSIAAPVAASGEVVLQATGYVIPAHQLLISPKVSGMVVSLNIEEGRRVEKGTVLAELESVDYQADVARAKAMLQNAQHKLAEMEHGSRPEEIRAAKADLAEAIAQRNQLYLEYKRNIGLRPNKTVTEREFEQSESAYRAMEQRAERLQNTLKMLQDGPRVERIDMARADVLQAQADLAKAEWRLGNCTIVAPISGTILKKNAEIGNVVNPVAFNGSFSLCEMADLSDLEVDLSIQERNDLSKVHKGQKCKVRAEAFPDRVYDGVVSRLMPIADRAKGAVPVRVKLTVPADEEGVYLKPEMSAVVSFLK